MARKLPWLRGKGSSKAKSGTGSAQSTSSKAQKRPRTDSQSSSDSPPPAVYNPRRTVLERVGRPRSSSNTPPPSPPPSELMRPGLDGDDIFVMVEDELYSTAQKYTQHLHHAEYKQLKKQAKEQHASDIRQISRPTVAAKLSSEKRIHKEQKGRAEKHRKSLVTIGAVGKVSSGEQQSGIPSDTDSDPEVIREDDPWLGDTLGTLLSAQQPQSTSLVGLQGVASSTRASKGYRRPETPVNRSSMFDIGKENTRAAISTSNISPRRQETTASDSEDLDRSPAVVTGNRMVKIAHAPERHVSTLEPPARKARTHETGPDPMTASAFTKSKSGRKGILKPSLQTFDDDSTLRPTPLLPKRTIRTQEQTMKRNEGGVEEIPVFLV